MKTTSWSAVAPWYHDLVGERGHYYHQHVIWPALARRLQVKPGDHVLELGCGQGVYARTLPSGVHYLGIDLSRALVQAAARQDRDQAHSYQVGDATHDLALAPQTYDHALSILALQNMVAADQAIAQMARAVKRGGDLSLVLNHPAFRIPRQSSWGEDVATKVTYRRVDRYLSPLEIPVNAHPGDKTSPVTWSYHQPLSYYIDALAAHGCYLVHLDELVSDRESQGKKRRTENRARAEFPLFAYLYAVKIRD